MSELADLSALEQAALVRRREVRPSELVRYYLDRIERRSEELGAFVTVTPERALDEALAVERQIRSGEVASPLAGVPSAVKDLNCTAGVPTQFGSSLLAGFVPDVDDFVVQHMRRAGLVSLGKTNVPEFGLPCYTEPDIAPPARTPYDPSRSAGGSSGGAGAAVAGGLVPLAQGNDGAGSIRIPASVCGLVGVKPTRGRVSNGPVFADTNGLGVNGPLARNVADAAALLDILAGAEPGDPWPASPPPTSYLAAALSPPGRLRIGRFIDPPVPDASVDPECVAAWEAASSLLESLGHEVEDVARPWGPELFPHFLTLWSAGAASLPVPPEREADLRPLTRWLRERGRAASATELVGAQATLALAVSEVVQRLARFDAILTPTLAEPPVPVGSLRNDEDPEADFLAQARFTPFTAPVNVSGQPAVTLPLHATAEGLPIGVQLIGRFGEEHLLLSLAAQLEAAMPHGWRPPPGW
jgi:amidase